MEAAPLDIGLVHDTPSLRGWFLRGDSPRLVLCFSGIGRDEDVCPPYEFAASASNDGRDSVLFLADPARSWLNAPGLIEEVVALAQVFVRHVTPQEVVTLGHSMGGFAALVIANFIDVKVAVGFAPQFSVHPEVAADEERWKLYRDRIADFRIRDVASQMTKDTQYYVLHGRHPREAVQRDAFRPVGNLRQFVLPGVVHDVPQALKREGLLNSVVSACFNNRPRLLRRLLDPIGGERRVLTEAAT